MLSSSTSLLITFCSGSGANYFYAIILHQSISNLAERKFRKFLFKDKVTLLITYYVQIKIKPRDWLIDFGVCGRCDYL
jgi:hypothetical protein